MRNRMMLVLISSCLLVLAAGLWSCSPAPIIPTAPAVV